LLLQRAELDASKHLDALYGEAMRGVSLPAHAFAQPGAEVCTTFTCGEVSLIASEAIRAANRKPEGEQREAALAALPQLVCAEVTRRLSANSLIYSHALKFGTAVRIVSLCYNRITELQLLLIQDAKVCSPATQQPKDRHGLPALSPHQPRRRTTHPTLTHSPPCRLPHPPTPPLPTCLQGAAKALCRVEEHTRLVAGLRGGFDDARLAQSIMLQEAAFVPGSLFQSPEALALIKSRRFTSSDRWVLLAVS
jgi:hypothetical protein